MSHSMIIQCFNVKEIINSIFSGIFRFFKNRTCQVSCMLCRLRILTVLIGESEQHKKRVWYMHTADTCRRSSVRKICGITRLFKSSPPHHTGWPPPPPQPLPSQWPSDHTLCTRPKTTDHSQLYHCVSMIRPGLLLSLHIISHTQAGL